MRHRTRWQILFDFLFNFSNQHRRPPSGGCSVRQGRRQIKAKARECTMYSTELESADLARDCPQCATGTALPLNCCAVAQLRSRQVVSAFSRRLMRCRLYFAAYGGDKRSAA